MASEEIPKAQDEARQESPENQESPAGDAALSRRNLLTAGGVAAAAAVLPACKGTYTPEPYTTPTAEPEPYTTTTPEPYPANNFPQPQPIYPDANGNTNLGDVHVEMHAFSSCAGSSGQVRSYNGLTPGPTIVADPGGKISLILHNDLPANPGAPNDQCGQPNNMNTPHCFNTTNMHFHGLHVSPCSIWNDGIPDCEPGHTGQPQVASDDVLIDIPPLVEGGQTQEYCVWLPDFHAPGTHWYHSHKHGATAIQVANGMEGALIVREPTPIIDPSKDFIWIIQEALPDSEDYKIYPGFGSPNSIFYINGECGPTLNTQTGKTLRLRFINATGTPQGVTSLKLVKCTGTCPAVWDSATNAPPTNIPNTPTKDMYLMAVDGITFYGHSPQAKSSWNLAGGNRADFLVQFEAGEEGTYYLLKDTGGAFTPQAAVPQVLGYINVETGAYQDTPPQDVQLPPQSDAPAYLQPIPQSEVTGSLRTIEFQMPAAQQFLINGMKYSSDPQFDIVEPLGCTRAWNLKNTHGSIPGTPIAHPFHIHVNPFQLVVAPNVIKLIDQSLPDEPGNRIWWDTINIPLESQFPGGLIMWTRFWDYPGRFVLHCHILVHEDLGMMANVRVEDPAGEGAGPCQQLAVPIPVNCQ